MGTDTSPDRGSPAGATCLAARPAPGSKLGPSEASLSAAVLERLGLAPGEAVALGGGVAANGPLREATAELCERRGVRLKLVPLELCTDNAAMIGSAARFAPRLPYPDYLSYDAFASARAPAPT